MVTTEILVDRDLEQAVLMVLRYFSIFRYPLTVDEIQKYASLSCNLNSVNEILDELTLSNKAFLYRGHYSIKQDIKDELVLRETANIRAMTEVNKAIVVGKLISNFPFVRFVGLSGSLSKGVAHENSDFDFFIITAENRLWICRTILHLFKKLTFITGDQHKFCMNYFIDNAHLEIEEKNIFTAVELATLYPVAGTQAFEDLKRTNSWVFDFLPNNTFRSFSINTKGKGYVFKKALEAASKFIGAGFLNHKFMAFTDKRWRKKWNKKGYPFEDYDHAFKTNLYVSKNHPANYQKRILRYLADFKEL